MLKPTFLNVENFLTHRDVIFQTVRIDILIETLVSEDKISLEYQLVLFFLATLKNPAVIKFLEPPLLAPFQQPC
jgi:hypothetical protein